MQIITVSAEDHVTLCSVDASFLSKVDSKDVEITLVKNFKLLLQSLLVVSKELQNQRLSSRILGEPRTLPSRVNKNMSPHSMKRPLT